MLLYDGATLLEVVMIMVHIHHVMLHRGRLQRRAVPLDDVLAKLRHIEELFLTLLASVHNLNALEELIEVEPASVVVGFRTLKAPQQIYLLLSQLVDTAAT